MWQVAVLVGVFCGVFQWGMSLAHALPEEIANGTAIVEEIAAAEETGVAAPTIGNNPKTVLRMLRAAADVLDPTAEVFYDFHNQEWKPGVSGSVYSFTSNAIHLGRVKLGYASANTIYGGLDVDVPGLVARYLPGAWPQLEKLLGTVSKYSATGYVVGADVERGEVVHGPSFGATLRF